MIQSYSWYILDLTFSARELIHLRSNFFCQTVGTYGIYLAPARQLKQSRSNLCYTSWTTDIYARQLILARSNLHQLDNLHVGSNLDQLDNWYMLDNWYVVDLTCISLTNLSRKKHIIKGCQTVHFKLIYIYTCISSVCRFFTEDAAKTPAACCIISGLDYCNCLLMGTPNSPLQFQKIQNFAARLVLLAPRHSHSTPPGKTALASHFRTY